MHQKGNILEHTGTIFEAWHKMICLPRTSVHWPFCLGAGSFRNLAPQDRPQIQGVTRSSPGVEAATSERVPKPPAQLAMQPPNHVEPNWCLPSLRSKWMASWLMLLTAMGITRPTLGVIMDSTWVSKLKGWPLWELWPEVIRSNVVACCGVAHSSSWQCWERICKKRLHGTKSYRTSTWIIAWSVNCINRDCPPTWMKVKEQWRL